MELNGTDTEFELLIEQLNNEQALAAYKAPYDGYRPALLPRLLGKFLVTCGNLVYGKEPSYLKFRAVEVIARVPYHSWASAAFTLMTLFYADEKRALKLSTIKKYALFASDNETMHVVVISALSQKEERARVVRYTIIPMVFAFFYFWMSYVLYLIKPRWSLETNYLFEQHAFDSYQRFLDTRGEELKQKRVESEYLTWYGRHPRNQYELFRSIRNDEIVHRNRSIHEIELNERRVSQRPAHA
ncbi:MAG TPA: alternative oxidase [Candidatus Paceibacterota bacterium]|nr:alternative oxidase [Candidatus Paceibacterota bacterium]